MNECVLAYVMAVFQEQRLKTTQRDDRRQ